jgi:hypothetical protein
VFRPRLEGGRRGAQRGDRLGDGRLRGARCCYAGAFHDEVLERSIGDLRRPRDRQQVVRGGIDVQALDQLASPVAEDHHVSLPPDRIDPCHLEPRAPKASGNVEQGGAHNRGHVRVLEKVRDRPPHLAVPRGSVRRRGDERGRRGAVGRTPVQQEASQLRGFGGEGRDVDPVRVGEFSRTEGAGVDAVVVHAIHLDPAGSIGRPRASGHDPSVPTP